MITDFELIYKYINLRFKNKKYVNLNPGQKMSNIKAIKKRKTLI